jgi:hypothetical protein
MKQLSLLLFSLLMLGCQTDKDALALEGSTEEFEVETMGRGMDCGLPLIDFKDKLDEVEKITGSSWGRFYAYNLSPELWQGKILKVKIRKTRDSELGICTTFGPWYPWVTIVSARVTEECLEYRQAPAVSVEGPVTGRVNEVVPLSVSFGVSSGCGQFNQFVVESLAGTTHTVQVRARYAGCICTQVAPILQATYPFQANQPGVYTVRFRKADNSFVTHTVTIQ